MNPDLHLPAGSTADGPYLVGVSPERAGWTYSGLSVVHLEPGVPLVVSSERAEMLVLPLAGSCRVTVGDETHELAGRTSVFAGPTDFSYVPRGATATLVSEAGGRFALPSAVCEQVLPFRYGPVESVPVELRGAGQASRQVNNFCTPDAFEADRMIACEVLTPAGNWSSYPPHKHDTASAGEETRLEETYYHRVDPPQGFAFQRVYTDDRSIDETVCVEDGDLVMVPRGYHPVGAAHGYDLYYLNVMAGPERRWIFRNDPAHDWMLKRP